MSSSPDFVRDPAFIPVRERMKRFDGNDQGKTPVRIVIKAGAVKDPVKAQTDAQKAQIAAQTQETITKQTPVAADTLGDRTVAPQRPQLKPQLTIQIPGAGQKPSVSKKPSPSTPSPSTPSTSSTTTPTTPTTPSTPTATVSQTPTAVRKARTAVDYDPDPIKNAVLRGDVVKLKEFMNQNKGNIFYVFVDLLKENTEGTNQKLFKLLDDIYRGKGNTYEKNYVLDVLQTFLTLSSEKTAKKEFSDAALKLVYQLSEVSYLLPMFRDLIRCQKGEMFTLAVVKLLNKSGQEHNDKLYNLLMEFHETGTDQEKEFVIGVFQTLLTFAADKSTRKEYGSATERFFREMNEKAQEIIKDGEQVLKNGEALIEKGRKMFEKANEMGSSAETKIRKAGKNQELKKEGLELNEKAKALRNEGESIEDRGNEIKQKGQEAIDKGQKMLAVFYTAAVGANENSGNAKKFIVNVVSKDQKNETTVKNLKALLSGNFEVLADNRFPRKLAFDKKIIKSEENLLRFIKKLIQNLNAKNPFKNPALKKEVQEVSSYVFEYDSLKRFPMPKAILNTLLNYNAESADLIQQMNFCKCVLEAVEDYHLDSEVISNFKNMLPNGTFLRVIKQKGFHKGAVFEGLGMSLRLLKAFFEKNCAQTDEVAANLNIINHLPGGIFCKYEGEMGDPNGLPYSTEFEGVEDGSITKLRKQITRLRDQDLIGNKDEIARLLKEQQGLREKMHKELDAAIVVLRGALKDPNKPIKLGS